MPRIHWIHISLAFTLLCSSNVCTGQLWSGVLSPARATGWTQAGVTGGIPSNSWTQCTNTQCAAVTSAGTSATAAQILTALQNAPANTYVLLGPGTYNLSTGICAQGLNNVELRGSGANATFLTFSGAANCMEGAGTALIGFESSDGSYPGGVSTAYSWSGAAQGATSITFPGGLSGATITPGSTMIVLDQCDTGYSGAPCSGTSTDNKNYFNCGDAYTTTPTGCAVNGPDGGFARVHRFQSEIVQATSCVPSCSSGGSTTVNITPPLIHPNWVASQTPQAWLIQPSSNVGVRNLSIDGTGTTNITGVGLNSVENAWVQGVRIVHSDVIGIWLIDVAHASLLDNYIDDVGQGLSCQGGFPACDPWGIKDSQGADNLIQNNIIQATRVGIANGEGPATGDVVAYNFLINQYDESDFVWGALWQHSNGDDFDLYEGNIGSQLFEDQIHGSHLMITAFRNFFTGWETCANGQCGTYTAKAAGTSAIDDLSYNRYTNAVANVLGTPGITTNYSSTTSMYYGNTQSAYVIGSGNTGGSTAIPADPVVGTSVMRWGNYDVANAAVMECTAANAPVSACTEDERGDAAPIYPALSSPSTVFPMSFYLSGKPSWWPSSIPFPPIGPDVTGGNLGICAGTLNTPGQYGGVAALSNSQCAGTSLTASQWGGHVYAIPAMACYLNTMQGPPDGSGNALTFDPASCYGGSGSGSAPATAPAPPTNLTATPQ